MNIPIDILPTINGMDKVWFGKYTFNVTEVLANAKKIYSHFIRVPQGEKLVLIMAHFKFLIGLEIMCVAIDGTHIRLVGKPLINLIPTNFWNQRDHYSIFLQGICDAHLLLWDNVYKRHLDHRNSRCCTLSGFICTNVF